MDPVAVLGRPGVPQGSLEHAERSIRQERWAVDAIWKRVVAVAPIVVLLSCTIGAPSIGPSSPGSPAPSPGGSDAALGRPSSSPIAPAAPSPSAIGECARVTETAAFAAASRDAMDQLILAIGNPDVNAPSEASAAFDRALAAGDPTAIAATADVVLAHLARSRDALVDFVGCRSSVVGVGEWDALVSGLESAVIAIRDAGVTGSSSGVEAGRARFANALQDHFWQAVKGKVLEEASMRWPDGRIVRASRARFGQPVTNAFDGQPDSMWTAGDAPAPQWIEVDLGRSVSIVGIRLLTGQDGPGMTDHQVTIQTSTGGSDRFTRFTGSTTDRQLLVYRAPDAVPNVQVVRVTTLASDPAIGWREVEVQLAPESEPRACASGTANVALGRPVTASASLPGSPPGLAVDGRPETAWSAGAPAPQQIEVDLGGDVAVSEVRLLVAQASGDTSVHVVNARDTAGNYLNLAILDDATRGGQWLSVPGPTPCVGLRWISVETGAGTGPVAWSEIEVLAKPMP